MASYFLKDPTYSEPNDASVRLTIGEQHHIAHTETRRLCSGRSRGGRATFTLRVRVRGVAVRLRQGTHDCQGARRPSWSEREDITSCPEVARRERHLGLAWEQRPRPLSVLLAAQDQVGSSRFERDALPVQAKMDFRSEYWIDAPMPPPKTATLRIATTQRHVPYSLGRGRRARAPYGTDRG